VQGGMMRLLIVDGTNNFLRNYVAIPALDINGTPIGGVVGFLHSLRSFIERLRPTKIVITWDGPGGSQKRRALIKDYKKNRKPARLNRNFEFEEDNQEENKLYQQQELIRYLQDLPVSQILIENIEADDVIAYLCGMFRDEQKIIASGDNDFVQLLDKNTLIYKPKTKMLFTTKDCLEKFGIHPNNFALAKAIAGDQSDNIKGIKGIGFKTLVKYFPEFAKEEKIQAEQWLKSIDREQKKYMRIIEGQDVVMTNLKAVRLDEVLIGFSSVNKVHKALERPIKYSPTNIKMKLLQNGLTSFTDYNFFDYFRRIEIK
jgi:DNA polymerase-1